MPRPMEVVADERERADRDVAAELVAIIVSTHGTGLVRGPRRRVGRVGVHDVADLAHVGVDGRVRSDEVSALLDDLAEVVGDTITASTTHSARRLDDEQVARARPAGSTRTTRCETLLAVRHDELPARRTACRRATTLRAAATAARTSSG